MNINVHSLHFETPETRIILLIFLWVERCNYLLSFVKRQYPRTNAAFERMHIPNSKQSFCMLNSYNPEVRAIAFDNLLECKTAIFVKIINLLLLAQIIF